MGVGEAKTSDFSRQEYGTFHLKVPMFTSKKSDVLAFPGVKTRFMAEKTVKVLMPRFCDISEQAQSWWLPMVFSGH